MASRLPYVHPTPEHFVTRDKMVSDAYFACTWALISGSLRRSDFLSSGLTDPLSTDVLVRFGRYLANTWIFRYRTGLCFSLGLLPRLVYTRAAPGLGCSPMAFGRPTGAPSPALVNFA